MSDIIEGNDNGAWIVNEELFAKALRIATLAGSDRNGHSFCFTPVGVFKQSKTV